MKILLDECVPSRLKKHFQEFSCVTVADAGLKGLKNGALLSRAESLGFSVFLTLDKGIAYQQNFSIRKITIFLLRAPSSRIFDLVPLIEKCKQELQKVDPGTVVYISQNPL